jgi:hypothetical protein
MQSFQSRTLSDEVRSLKRLLTLAVLLVVTTVGAPAQATQPEAITGTTEFRVIEKIEHDPWYKVIVGARILVIGPDGRLMTTGLTNREGKWPAQLTVPVDRRFAPSHTLGTVTAIAVADGYVERLSFDVPVAPEGAVQVMSLQPIRPHQRNEPGYELGMLHRLLVLPLLDHYATQAGLGRQPSVEGDWNSPHWSPSVAAGALGGCRAVAEERIPPEAAETALQFVDALYAYDTERIRELVEPSQRDMFAKEAFNGPGAEPVRVTGPVRITHTETCGWRRLRLTVMLPAEYMKRQQTHMIRLTLRPRWGKWRITDMAANYDVR